MPTLGAAPNLAIIPHNFPSFGAGKLPYISELEIEKRTDADRTDFARHLLASTDIHVQARSDVGINCLLVIVDLHGRKWVGQVLTKEILGGGYAI